MWASGRRILYLAVVGVTICSWSERVSASVIDNGGFENDYAGWTLVKEAEREAHAILAIVNNGDTVVQDQPLTDHHSGSLIRVGKHEYLPLTLHGSEGGKLAVQLQNRNAITRMWQEITLPAEATALSWEMAYTNYNNEDNSQEPGFLFNEGVIYQGVAIHIRDLDGVILETIFVTGPDSPMSVPMSTFSAAISPKVVKEETVRLEVEVATEAYFLPISFDNFRIEVAPLETLEDTLVVLPTLPPGWGMGKKIGWQGKTLPPGLEKQDKIPPGFENGQKNGFKK
jgi:hypothetical protein